MLSYFKITFCCKCTMYIHVLNQDCDPTCLISPSHGSVIQIFLNWFIRKSYFLIESFISFFFSFLLFNFVYSLPLVLFLLLCSLLSSSLWYKNICKTSFVNCCNLYYLSKSICSYLNWKFINQSINIIGSFIKASASVGLSFIIFGGGN